MQYALDSCILIDCQEDDSVLRKIRSLNHKGDEISAPLTVVGEVVHICMNKGFDVHKMMDMIEEMDIEFIFPSPGIRKWCQLVDRANEIDINYGSSITDRTHLAYALMNEADFFVTHKSESRNLRTPEHEMAKTKVVDMDRVRGDLRKR